MTVTVRSRLEDVVGERGRRFVEFLGVGATGAVLDVATTATALGQVHYLLANGLGFLLAVSWNFAGNWFVTFDRPEGSIPWQYASYVGLHSATFGVRAVVIALLVEHTPTPVMVATFVGIGAAAIANFLASEEIFDGSDELWLDAVGAVNQVAHLLYHSRLRGALRSLGLYGPLFAGYQGVLGLLYRDDTHEIEAGDDVASAELYTEGSAEVVSIMHTVEKEREILDRFVDELQADDHVFDVGANLGVFACLAADVVDGDVVAFEPYVPTAERCRDNLNLGGHFRAKVEPVALGDELADVELGIEREEVGTQTPSMTGADEVAETVEVNQLPGDSYVEKTPDVRPPTVVKVDVEGAETAVLDGLQQTLADDVRLVYVETHDSTFHDEGSSTDVLTRLDALGFDAEVVDADGQVYVRGEKPGKSAPDSHEVEAKP